MKKPKRKLRIGPKYGVGEAKKVTSALSGGSVPDWAQDPKKKYDKFGYEIDSKKYEQDLNYVPKSYVDKPVPGKSSYVRVLLKKDLAPRADATQVNKKIIIRKK